MKPFYVLTFSTLGGKDFNLKINDANTAATAAQLNGYGTNIANADPFSAFSINVLKSVNLVTQTVRTITL